MQESLLEVEDRISALFVCKTADGRCPAEIGEWWGAAAQWGSALDDAAWGGRLACPAVVAADVSPPGFEPVSCVVAADESPPGVEPVSGRAVAI